MKTIIVVERQSQYDGGFVMAVFSSIDNAREYIENQKDFTEWEDEDTTKNDCGDFYYTYSGFVLDKNNNKKESENE